MPHGIGGYLKTKFTIFFYLFNAYLSHLCYPVAIFFFYLLSTITYYSFYSFKTYTLILKPYLNPIPISKLIYFHKRHSMLYVLSSCWNALFSLTNTLADLFLADLLFGADLYLGWPFFLLTMQNYDCLRTQPYILFIFCKKMHHSWCRSVLVRNSQFIVHSYWPKSNNDELGGRLQGNHCWKEHKNRAYRLARPIHYL